MHYQKDVKFSDLVGKKLKEIEVDGDEVLFVTYEDERFKLYHSQDCCESVSVEDVCGDLADLMNTPILLAEESSSSEPDFETKAKREREKAEKETSGGYYYGAESETWTFYKLATIKGSVTIRWYGTSNGYYSERVDFAQL